MSENLEHTPEGAENFKAPETGKENYEVAKKFDKLFEFIKDFKELHKDYYKDLGNGSKEYTYFKNNLKIRHKETPRSKFTIDGTNRGTTNVFQIENITDDSRENMLLIISNNPDNSKHAINININNSNHKDLSAIIKDYKEPAELNINQNRSDFNHSLKMIDSNLLDLPKDTKENIKNNPDNFNNNPEYNNALLDVINSKLSDYKGLIEKDK